MLSVNTILKFENGVEETSYERILFYDQAKDLAVTIDIYDKNALPAPRQISNLETLIANNYASIVNEEPFLRFLDPTDRPKSHLQIRDKIWNAIKPILFDEQGNVRTGLFSSKSRSQIINEEATKNKAFSKHAYYRHIRKYWQRGQTSNAVLPDYINGRGKGKERDSPIKLGRPVTYIREDGIPGIPITTDIRRIFLRGIEVNHKNGATLDQVYQAIMQSSFFHGFETRNGVLTPILLPPESRPTFRQFEYYFHKNWEKDLVNNARKYYGSREYDQKLRELTGSSNEMAIGPGSMYQIDSTLVDLYLRAFFDRLRVVGRPILYVLIDVFSSIIAGFALTLENASWNAATLAYVNMLQNKVDFCNSQDIVITEDQWPVHHKPHSVFADRFETLSINSDSLIKNFGIVVANAPPYRPEYKSSVEREFRLINDITLKDQPGFVPKNIKRGDPDYRVNAALNLEELRAALTHLFIYHNLYRPIKPHNNDRQLLEDKVQPFPIDYWNWGIKNRGGQLKEFSVDLARILLLPREQASITEHGIVFRGHLYDSEHAKNTGMLAGARMKGRETTEVMYDPNLINSIYMQLDHGSYAECKLSEEERADKNSSWYEIFDKNQQNKSKKPDVDQRKRQGKAYLNQQIKAIVDPAVEATKVAKTGASKADQVKGIRQNRSEELDRERSAARPQDDEVSTTDAWDGYIPLRKSTNLITKLEENIQNEQDIDKTNAE